MNIKPCCGCPDGQEYIYCGCDCHKKQDNSYPCELCGQIYSEESGAYDGFICDDCLEREG